MDPKTADDLLHLNEDELARALRDMDARVAGIGTRLHQARNRYDALLDPNRVGTREQLAADRAGAEPELRALEAQCMTEANDISMRLYDVLERGLVDRIALSDAEAARAASLAPFVKEDAERLSLGQLVTRVTAAMQAGDKAELYLIDRYVRQRLDQTTAGKPEDRQALHRALESIGARLGAGSAAKLRGQAEKVMERARDVRGEAMQRDGTAILDEMRALRGLRPTG